ncbi:MAG: prepilin-type N-terminal cleavage/methylation domain-containing protein [Acidobacteriota bacterium]|nr:prepilin-type N-terminal cleavage/methylation domain-containing protein [Acidobacteriota bacterium]MDH3529724.1 prepilin-type N-terminal cleavage/methylation domain-containing protein [Acidobacteriota bacterium]
MKVVCTKYRRQAGFNLIELMIVIAIIALLIGVGVPAWQSMVQSGNETTAVQSLNTIRTLQAQYAAKNRGSFAPTFDRLIQSVRLDEKFKGENPVVNGYVFRMTVQEGTSARPSFYSINADPQVATGLQATGSRFFYFDSTLGTIKQKEGEPAKPTDPSV